MLIEKINSPADVKKLSAKELTALAEELRGRLIDVISKNGGHLSSNLGVVELTVSLHFVFDSPDDRILWDVGHQSYVHKLLTAPTFLEMDISLSLRTMISRKLLLPQLFSAS